MAKKRKNSVPKIKKEQIALLEKLTNTPAVSGDESGVRKIVLEEIEGYADKIEVDSLGNVLATCNGTADNRIRVMLAAHMDEIGLLIVSDDKKGIFRFEIVGGIDARQLPGKPVWVGKDKVPGVIGAKPVHLTTSSERSNTMKVGSLRVDVGPEAEKKVSIGDGVTFATEFHHNGPSFLAKSLDNRLGVATLIELVKHAPPNIDLLAAFTVQEEVGLRGARVAAYAFDPDMAIALDSTPAYDLPHYDPEDGNYRYNTRLDHGPAIYVADRATLSDPRLIQHFIQTAEALKIPYQLRQPGGGGTDAGTIHRTRAGIPSVSISVPGRYAHTAVGIARRKDWENTLALVYNGLSRIQPELLSEPR
jgi:endoglucanase